MRLGSYFQSSLATCLARGALFVLLACIATCCMSGLRLEDSPVAEHCLSAQQSQDKDDTTVMLQRGQLKVERLSDEEVEKQERHMEEERLSDEEVEKQERHMEVELPVQQQHAEPWLAWVRRATSLSLPEGDPAKILANRANIFKESTLSLLSRLQTAHKAMDKSSEGLWLLLAMLLVTCLAFCGVLLPSILADSSNGKNSHRGSSSTEQGRSASMAAASRQTSMTPSGTALRLAGPGMASPLMPQSSPLVQSAIQPVGRTSSGVVAESLRHSAALPSLASLSSTVAGSSKKVPLPLCPTLVLKACEARFGIPMVEIAQLGTEGELNIVGLSGNHLLRAYVRKVGRKRSLEISMTEAGSTPRATIGPVSGVQDLGRPDDNTLEIRGFKGAFYGLLEMRPSGACYVIKDGETMMIIDGDSDSLQLQIKSGGGHQVASVRCSAELFGGVDHVEIRVEPGVDTVLVLACVLSVLLFPPTQQ